MTCRRMSDAAAAACRCRPNGLPLSNPPRAVPAGEAAEGAAAGAEGAAEGGEGVAAAGGGYGSSGAGAGSGAGNGGAAGGAAGEAPLERDLGGDGAEAGGWFGGFGKGSEQASALSGSGDGKAVGWWRCILEHPFAKSLCRRLRKVSGRLFWMTARLPCRRRVGSDLWPVSPGCPCRPSLPPPLLQHWTAAMSVCHLECVSP